MVGLRKVNTRSQPRLSGGMRKRVGLARAIAVRLDVILYDEPTTGLDPINVRRINELFEDSRSDWGSPPSSSPTTRTPASPAGSLGLPLPASDRMGGEARGAREARVSILREFVKGGAGVLEEDRLRSAGIRPQGRSRPKIALPTLTQ